MIVSLSAFVTKGSLGGDNIPAVKKDEKKKFSIFLCNVYVPTRTKKAAFAEA
jgi:hypothetical protein